MNPEILAANLAAVQIHFFKMRDCKVSRELVMESPPQPLEKSMA